MNSLRFIGSEFAYFFGNWKRLIPILAILFIPVLYAGTFLWAFWDPYGHLDRMPVAIVNEDKGADLDGSHLSVGDELVRKLKENPTFKWSFVTYAQAREGLSNNTYYMIVDIPSDFSEQAAHSVKSKSGALPQLNCVTNDRYNFIASQIGRNAVLKIKDETAQNLTQEYTKNLLANLSKLADGTRQASDGASKLADGANSLLANSAPLQTGAEQAVSASAKLANGISQLSNGAGSLASGQIGMAQGAQNLSDGLSRLLTGGQQLTFGAGQTLTGIQQLQQGLVQSSSGLSQSAASASSLSKGLQQYAVDHPALSTDSSFQNLLTTSSQVAQSTQQLSAAQQSLVQGGDRLQQGQTQFVASMNQMQSKLQQAKAGADQIAQNQQKLLDGSQKLASGLQTAADGAGKLASGAASLSAGIGKYTDGASKLASGAQQYSNELKSASNQLPQEMDTAHAASVISNPILLNQEQAGSIPTYGSGFAPYFLSLGLFVGALLMSIVVAFRQPSVDPKSGIAWFAGKFLLLASIAMIQALLADFMIIKGLGLHVANHAHFVWFSLLTSLTFLSIVQFLVSSLGDPGRFLAVILLILQLTSSSGSYPSILSPELFQKLAQWVPMTYTISGFRYLIGGGESDIMLSSVNHLLVYSASFLALTFFYFVFRYQLESKGFPFKRFKRNRNNRKSVQITSEAETV